MKRVPFLLSLLLVAGVFCAVRGEPAQAPKMGGTLKIATQASPPTLDTHAVTTTATRLVATHFLEPLVTFGENYAVVPMLAESWHISPDGKAYTFKLRQGIKFHNGKEMTADDVVASIERFLQVTARKPAFRNLKSFTVKDKYTVEMVLAAASGTFLDALASPAAELVGMPKEIVTGKAANALKIPDDFIGTGPYQLVDFKPDQFVKLKRFKDYKPLPGERNGLGGAKIAYFDEIQMDFMKEAGARVAAVESGEYGFADAIPGTEYSRLSANPKTKVAVTKPLQVGHVLFNHMNKLSGNLKFRQAVLAAMDMDAIGLAVGSGNRDLTRLNPCLWPRESVWHFESAQASALYNQRNPEKAKTLLAEAGYKGEPVVLLATREYDFMYKIMITLADQLKRVGVNAKVEVLDWPGMRARWGEKESWHISTTSYLTAVLVSPEAWGIFWESGSSAPERAGYSHPEMDKAFKDLSLALTVEQRKVKLKDIQRIMYETLPHIPTVEIFDASLLRSDIQGFKGWYTNRFFGMWSDR